MVPKAVWLLDCFCFLKMQPPSSCSCWSGCCSSKACHGCPKPKIRKYQANKCVQIQVHQPISHSECASPCFIIPKKDVGIQFITDFRKINKVVVHESCKYNHTKDTIATIGNFQYATTIYPIITYKNLENYVWLHYHGDFTSTSVFQKD